MVVGGMKNQKDQTFLGIVSGVFLATLALVFKVLESPPNYVVIALVLSMIVSGILFIYAIIDYFSKPKLKSLPLSILSSNVVINGYGDKSTLPVSWTFSHNLKGTKSLSVEYRHKCSRDGKEYEFSNSVFGKLPVSGTGAQKNEVITCVRDSNHVALGGGAVPLKQIVLSLANHTLGDESSDKLIITKEQIKNDFRNRYHIIDIVFSSNGYEPVRKTLWIDRKGYAYNSKPESWPDEKTNLLT